MQAAVHDPVATLRPRIQSVLDKMLDRQRELLGAESPDLLLLVDAAGDLVAGGKRLRPAFCYWGWRGAGAPDDPAIVAASACLELFQAAALILGDLCLGWSDELLHASGLAEDALRRGRPVFERMRTELMGGQFLDVLEQATGGLRPDGQAERARRVIRYKSAKYSVEHPLLLGGALAGPRPRLLASYSAYGLALGEAFQLRDDVLGVFGDPDQTGKPAGDDLREGKRTILVAFALEQASAAQAETLERLLGDHALDRAGVDALRALIDDTGALDRVERLISELVERSTAALADAEVGPEARDALTSLITAATSRSV